MRSSQDSSSAEKSGSLLFADEPGAPSLFGDSNATQAERAVPEKKAKKTRKSAKKEPTVASGLFALETVPTPEEKQENVEEAPAVDAGLSADVENAVETPPTPENVCEVPKETPVVESTQDAPFDANDDAPVESIDEAPLPTPQEETPKAPEVAAPQESPVVEKTPESTPAPLPPRPVFEESEPDESSARASRQPSAYQVVARRYRPQTFEELIGQSTVARALSNAIETDRVGHAYLFTGARGVGKTSCARIFAKALNCVEGPTTKPCLKCDSCLGIATGDDVDVIEIDGASNRGVDEIRQLRQNATIAPSRSLYKIYIIDEVHMLTREAFNALLKTLEEPPARVKFIFCTTEPNKIPITILSRCQRFDFGGINGASIAERLAAIASQEGAQAEQGVFEILARRANGSMRDAQSLLEQLLSFAPTYITQNDVHNMLGSVDDEKIFQLLDATIKSDVARIFELLGELANAGVDFGVLIEQTLGIFRDLMVVSSGCGAKELTYASVARFPELQEIAQTLGARRILASLQILDQTSQRMRFSVQSRILVELAFARLSALDAFQPLEALIEQLRRGAVQISFNASDLSAPTSAPSDDKKKSERAITTPNEVPASSNAPPASVPFAPPTRDAVEESPDAPLPAPAENPPEANANAGSLLDYSPEQLGAIWRDATKVGVMLPFQASAFSRVDVEAPNGFIVVFPSSKGSQRKYCEDEKSKISARLSKILGFEISLRCLIDARAGDATVAPDKPANSGVGAPQGNYRNRSFENRPNGLSRAPFGRRPNLTEIEKNETVRQIKEIFDAEIYDVKPPRPAEKTDAESVPK